MTQPAQNQVTIATSNFNLETLNTKQLQNHIKGSVQANSNIAIFGRRGLGKTQISKQTIKEMGLVEVYMNLSVYERVDLGGYPDMLSPKEKVERFVNFILPRIYEPMILGDKKVVALLDEVDKADPSLWAPLLEFTQMKSINGRELPNLQSVIMTGNLISEGGARPSLPLLDRTEKYLVEATTDAWLEWAAESGEIHPSIYQFLMDNPTKLQGAVDMAENYADESPRSWHNASKLVVHGEAHGWDIDLINEKVSGCIGRKTGLDYKIYFQNYKVLLPIVNKIFVGDTSYIDEFKGLTPTEKLYTAIITCGRFANQLDAAKDTSDRPASIKHVGAFMQTLAFENILISVRQQLLVKRIVRWALDEEPSWNGILGAVTATADPS